MRARHDPPERAVARLRAAAALASSHGSVALARRCADDLRQLGAPLPDGPAAADPRSLRRSPRQHAVTGPGNPDRDPNAGRTPRERPAP